MAEEDKKKRVKRRIKKTQTVREKTASESKPKTTSKRHNAKRVIKRPVLAARNVGKREYHIIKPKDSGPGAFFTKSRSFIPSYFRNSWLELKQVKWPDRSQTIKLTFAVFMFSIVLGLAVAGADWVLEKVFREVILG